ncbi:hypothetical protein [Azomonas macrocytogenes]|uniref:ABC-type polysaccharide/polyol phosphate export permease n=1 Tax=Azomonas macrocytogenes TaxID=69962 RepID=A0A839T6W5_AZOMA|nr:hypothetical protein [Azomonas macrocytogenes]MBB3105221.1 ABC-type polysaccharide/polyol phosphate export permease [Azomonas macrocytogenes]
MNSSESNIGIWKQRWRAEAKLGGIALLAMLSGGVMANGDLGWPSVMEVLTGMMGWFFIRSTSAPIE